jgi:hypothetical protein
MKHITLLLLAAASICTSAFAQPRPKNVYTSSTTLNVEQFQNQAQPVVLNRTLYAGYNTICLPMSLSAEQLKAAAKDVQIERLEMVRQEGSTLNMYFLDCTNEGIEAGVPYLIFSPTRQYLRAKNTEAYAIDTDLKTIRMDDGQGNQVSFASGWTSRQKNGLYGIPAKQDVEILESVLVRTTGEQAFLPTRCGFSWEQQSATAQKLEIVHMNAADITAIGQQLKANSNTDETIYDLNGRRVNAPVKGLYIKGGKKIVK